MNLPVLAMLFALVLAGCGLPESAAIAQAADVSPDATAVTNAPSAQGAEAAQPAITPEPPVPQLPPNLPEAAREVIKLAHGQVDDKVIVQFISNVQEPFHLDAEQIVYLRDLGISSDVLEAFMQREKELGGIPAEQPTTAATTAGPPSVVPLPPSPAASAPTEYPGGTPALPPPQVGPAVEVAQPSEPPPAAGAPVNNNFFFGALAPYGNWFTIPTYGFVWQPSCAVITPGWRPYWNNGNWTWSNAGWFWNSSYSWGWAPFHYGNWVNAPGAGWCWIPGRTWAPSWVTFRFGGGFCGWAPLPPGCGVSTGVGLTWAGSGLSVGFGFGYNASAYCWTPVSYFTAPNCAAYGVRGAAINQIYNNSTVINNYVVGNNNTIINNGIDPAQIAPHSRNEIRKMQLADVSSPAARAGGLPRGRPGDSSQIPVYRPSLGPESVAISRAPARSEARPVPVASRSTTGVASGSGTALGRRPAINQPDRLPAPNPRTPAVALLSPNGANRGASTLPGRGVGSRPNPAPGVQGGAAAGTLTRPGITRYPPNSGTPQAPGVAARPGGAYATYPGAAAPNLPSGRMEPRKSPGTLPPQGVPPAVPGANPGAVGGNVPGAIARPGFGSTPGSGQLRPGTPVQPPAANYRYSPRAGMAAPSPAPVAPARPQFQASPRPGAAGRPMPSYNAAPRSGGAPGGAAIRGRP